MVNTDPIADMLIRIKNAYLAGKKTVVTDFSKMLNEIAQILVKEGYLKSVKTEDEEKGFNKLKLTLKYKSHRPVLTEVKRISKPGVRIYARAKKIPYVKEGRGITIVSTPQGLMTNRQAKESNLGGEVICQIW